MMTTRYYTREKLGFSAGGDAARPHPFLPFPPPFRGEKGGEGRIRG